MAIRSEPFSGVILSGDDIQKFERQIDAIEPTQAARESFARGNELADEFAKQGFVRFKARSED